VAVGVSSVLGDWELPTLYWLPVWVGVPVMYAVFVRDYFREGQDFTAQPWDERGREIVELFRWRSWASREWGLWLLAAVLGLPMAVMGLVVGPPRADRGGSAGLLVLCGLITWVGLKCLDARIARRLLDAAWRARELGRDQKS
jgi:hypothetical protein